MAASSSLDICGVEVSFPFNPYSCQISYMEKVIRSLQRGTNALLESPTGTGKTLCLLCATLGWRRAVEAYQQLQERIITCGLIEDSATTTRMMEKLQCAITGDASRKVPDSLLLKNSGPPQIIYCSRTHAQLSQVVHELAGTTYTPKSVVIGSRAQSCLHPAVSRITNNVMQSSACRSLTQKQGCSYGNTVKIRGPEIAAEIEHNIVDIEAFSKLCGSRRSCPFFMARDMLPAADIIFVPYNYVMEEDFARRLEEVILIIDEAHNFEGICEQSSSVSLSSVQLSLAIEECIHAKEMAALTLNDPASDVNTNNAEHDVDVLRVFLTRIEDALDTFTLPLNEDGWVSQPALKIFEFLAGVGLNGDTKETLISHVDSALTLLSEYISGLGNGGVQESKGGLAHIQKFFRTIFNIDDMSKKDGKNVSKYGDSLSHYRMVVSETFLKRKSKLKGPEDQSGRTLSLICLSPSQVWRSLSLKIKALVLTSGTLAPLESFSSELAISFKETLENPHVIDPSQILVRVVPTGPTGVILNSTFHQRERPEYMSDLGATILNFARVVPHGMLIFFSSYAILEKTIAAWKQCNQSGGLSLWARLASIKTLVVEPKDKSEFSDSMTNFYNSINDNNSTLSGAAFFAVCRGKVSEGMDFADRNGRAVVITGLPYAPFKDQRIVLKKQYLDERAQNTGLSGSHWYDLQATRAVNQAIGRVIRHKHDYGAILLCDNRFASPKFRGLLPRWLRDYVVVAKDGCQSVSNDLSRFFEARLRAGLPVKNIPPKHNIDNGKMNQKDQLFSYSGRLRLDRTQVNIAYDCEDDWMARERQDIERAAIQRKRAIEAKNNIFAGLTATKNEKNLVQQSSSHIGTKGRSLTLSEKLTAIDDEAAIAEEADRLQRLRRRKRAPPIPGVNNLVKKVRETSNLPCTTSDPTKLSEIPPKPTNITSCISEETPKASIHGDCVHESTSTSKSVVTVPNRKSSETQNFLNRCRTTLGETDFSRFRCLLIKKKEKQLELPAFVDRVYSLFGNDRIEILRGIRVFMGKYAGQYDALLAAKEFRAFGVEKKVQDQLETNACGDVEASLETVSTSIKHSGKPCCSCSRSPAIDPFQAPCMHIACVSCWRNSAKEEPVLDHLICRQLRVCCASCNKVVSFNKLQKLYFR